MISPFKKILVTGGVGSVGRSVVERLLKTHPEVEQIGIFSRDEHKQLAMMQELGAHASRLTFMMGDIRDPARIEDAVKGFDAVVHAAAIRLVPMAAINPFEAVRTNVEGTRNLIRAAKLHGVKKVLAISSDKAVSPTTAYGSTKFLMERLLIDADSSGDTRFSMVRYANILSSRSSVAPLFVQQRANSLLTLTDPNMTRFSITMDEGIDLVLHGLFQGWGGEVICPRSPSYRVGDMAMAIGPDAEHQIIGARPGEKLHEAMFGLVEAPLAMQQGKHYIIAPQDGRWSMEDYCSETGAQRLEKLFEYDSGSNQDWLSVRELRKQVSTELEVNLD